MEYKQRNFRIETSNLTQAPCGDNVLDQKAVCSSSCISFILITHHQGQHHCEALHKLTKFVGNNYSYSFDTVILYSLYYINSVDACFFAITLVYCDSFGQTFRRARLMVSSC